MVELKLSDTAKATLTAGVTKIGILLLSAMVIFIIISIFLSFVISLKVNKRFKMGRRLSEECGREYMEAETDKYLLSELLESRKTDTGKFFLITFTLLKVTMLCTLVLTLFAVIFMSGEKSAFSNHFLTAFGITILIVSSISTFIGIWIGILSKKENNTYYATTPDTVEADKKAYKKALLASGTSIGSTLIVISVGLWLWSSSSATMPPVDKSFFGKVALFLFVGAVIWFFMMAIHMVYVTQYINIVSVVKVDYETDLINGTDKLNSLVKDRLHTTYMPTSITGETDWDQMRRQIKTKLLQYFGYNIRTLDKKQGEDEELVTANVANLWKYMLHSDGKELKHIMDYVESNKGDLDTQADKDAATVFINLIKSIRVAMRDIRANKTVAEAVKKFVRNMVVLGMAVFSFLLYLVFHSQYKNNAGRTIMTWTGIVLILTVLATYVGWVNSAMRL